MDPRRVRFPEVFKPLTRPARYKGAWGGRGSGKSHFFGGYLVLSMLQRRIRAVCLREVQNSIKDSVKQLIEDKITEYGLEDEFEITDVELRGPNDGLITFRGMKNHTAASIKSLEGFNVAWFEEAQAASQRSIDLLAPTIRAEDAELWFSWNPDQPTDPVDLFLRANPPTDAVVVRANYSDNPWFPASLEEDMRRDRQTDPAKYAHVWLGEYQSLADQQFIGWNLIKEAQERQFKRGARPVLFGLDVARFGDDRSVLAIRDGDTLVDLMVWDNLDTQQLAGSVVEVANKRNPDAIFVDGVGVGGGVVDRLRTLNMRIIEVNGGAKAGQETRYVNKRTEMWARMREWLEARGVIGPWDIEICAEMTGPHYSFDASNRIALEKKDDMKKRGLRSPDLADALSMTFAQPIAVPAMSEMQWKPQFVAPDEPLMDSW